MKLHTTVLIGGTRQARVLIAVLALLACFAASLSTKAATAPLLSSNRFLFIIDASASMKPFDKSLRENVFDLIYSGMRGRMTNGDTYGVWVVQDRNDTSFTMDIWRGHHAVEMGAKATAHVKDRGFKNNARLDVAMADALRVVRNVGDLTIVLVSNGETSIAGTPFDESINTRWRELAPRMNRAKSTLNTVLVAQDGALVAWAANGPDFLIEVPRVAPRPKPAKQEIAAKTSAPAAASSAIAKALAAAPAAAINPPPLFQKPRVATTPIIITKDTVAQEKREWAAMTSTATNESVAGETNTVVAATTPVTNSPASSSNLLATSAPAAPASATANSVTNNSVAKAEVVSSAASVAKTTEPISSNRTIAVTKPAQPKPAEPMSALVSANTAAPTPVPMRVEENRLSSQPLLWASIGGAAAVLCVLIGVFVARSQRREASLISQAIAQQRIHTS